MASTEPQILADSEVYPTLDAYERTICYKGWDPTDSIRLAQVQIKVARKIEESYLIVNVWTDAGWIYVHRLSADTFWSDVPGFSRWRQDRAMSKTKQHMDDAMAELVKIVQSGGLF